MNRYDPCSLHLLRAISQILSFFLSLVYHLNSLLEALRDHISHYGIRIVKEQRTSHNGKEENNHPIVCPRKTLISC